jgi:hypothetical protein
MYSIRALLIAESVIQDKTTGRMCVINVLERVLPAGYPLLIPRFTLFAMLERATEDDPRPPVNLRIFIGEDEVFSDGVSIDYGSTAVTRVVLEFQGFVLPKPGLLRATLTVGDASLTTYPIEAVPAGASVEVRQG